MLPSLTFSLLRCLAGPSADFASSKPKRARTTAASRKVTFEEEEEDETEESDGGELTRAASFSSGDMEAKYKRVVDNKIK